MWKAMPKFYRKARVLTVSGGKGGTGKSFVAVNLAAAMAMRLNSTGPSKKKSFTGNRVLLFDADFHLSNDHLFLGVKLSPCLDRFLKNPESLPEYIVSTEYGVDLISFGGDEHKINFIENNVSMDILKELNRLEMFYDWIIVDTGAGLSKMIIKQIHFADHSLLVTNPDATAMIDCYKMIKFITIEKPDFKNIDICMNRVGTFEEGYLTFKKLQDILLQFRVPVKIYYAGPVYYDRDMFARCLQRGIPAVLTNDNPNHIRESMNYIWDFINKKNITRKMESFFERIFLGE
jgi:flagellar biosynthesis protein FlhG